ncbi:hypothetical protein BU52_18950 [Streptomyces toyocaensis]|uniref:Uncharacterized protein n=1 Tax=Streptomyces toyocaensis TaxID=55952 RepID=A0A081XPX9_STRTO|nr:hypothetical protein [Streptomyces toyocaensis]KES05602.1 hypothetical protein BU52_18950 [Streptomyces toyocaensis]
MTATAFEYGPTHALVDPYAVGDRTDAAWWPSAAGQQDSDYLLAPPNPAERVDTAIDPRDRRRLELHAALTAAGIPPRPEDREAIESLSALSGSINTTIQRWLHHTL